MAVASFEGKTPRIGRESYIHPSPDVFGDVEIGSGCWIGPGARLRGDYGSIRVGDFTSIEDNCVVHARPGEVCSIGDWVTIGHGAIIHNALRIDNYAVIGMGAIIMDGAVIESNSVIAAGALISKDTVVKSGSVYAGVPAKLIKTVDTELLEGEIHRISNNYNMYASWYDEDESDDQSF